MRPDNSLLVKLQNYCVYQERSQYEVRRKLGEEGIFGAPADQVLSNLIEENFLNEERFALAYTGGKFRIKNWGKLKIKQGLRQKQVPEKMITAALNSIDEMDYLDTLKKVIAKKNALVKEKDPFKRKQLLLAYCAGRGFERELVHTVLAGTV